MWPLGSSIETCTSRVSQLEFTERTGSGEANDEDETCAGPCEGILGLGENGATAFASTGDPALDFFFAVVPDAPTEQVLEAFDLCWKERPDDAFRILLQTGNLRRGQMGKCDEKNFQLLLFHAYDKHPYSVIGNLDTIVMQTSLKYAMALMVHACNLTGEYSFGALARQAEARGVARLERGKPDLKRQRRTEKKARHLEILSSFAKTENVHDVMQLRVPKVYTDSVSEKRRDSKWVCSDPTRGTVWRDEDVADSFRLFIRKRDEALKECRGMSVVAKRTTPLVSVHCNALFEQVSSIFAEGLAREMMDHRGVALETREAVGLFCKWMPTPGGKFYKATAHLPGPTFAEMVSDKVEKIIGREMTPLSVLRKHYEIPESFSGGREFPLVNYQKMSAGCRKRWGKSVFRKNDQERYDEFVCSAVKGGAKMNIGGFTPDQVISVFMRAGNEGLMPDEAMVMWRAMCRQMRGTLAKANETKGFFPVCDVSGSMSGQPMEVAISLSMLFAEAQQGVFRNTMCTFHEEPTIFKLVGTPDKPEDDTTEGLADRVRQVMSMPWGGSTNLEAVFDLLLVVAKDGAVTESEMEAFVILVISDMEFDQACKV